MRMLIRAAFACGLLATLMAGDAWAQRVNWGVTATFSPQWKTVEKSKSLFSADRVDFKGKEFRVGLVHGRADGGDFSILFVQKAIDAGGVLQSGTKTVVMGRGVVLRGGVFQGAPVLFRVGRRFQMNLLISAGAGVVSGPATRNGVVVEARDEMHAFGGGTSLQPLGGVELGASVAVTPNIKLRVSSGLSLPGVSKLSVSGLMFFGR